MTYTIDTFNQNQKPNLIPPHGGYRKLKSYQTALIIYDLTPIFCERFLDDRTNKTNRTYRDIYVRTETERKTFSPSPLLSTHPSYLSDRSYRLPDRSYRSPYIPYKSRTPDQMVQSARSGCANLAEASQDSATSKKMEIKLVGVARGSLEELLFDCESFLRQRGLPLWEKDDPRVLEIRALSYQSDKSYKTYLKYFEEPESAANCLICLIHQANYLIDCQLRSLEKDFLEKGGFTERLYQKRTEFRGKR